MVASWASKKAGCWVAKMAVMMAAKKADNWAGNLVVSLAECSVEHWARSKEKMMAVYWAAMMAN